MGVLMLGSLRPSELGLGALWITRSVAPTVTSGVAALRKEGEWAAGLRSHSDGLYMYLSSAQGPPDPARMWVRALIQGRPWSSRAAPAPIRGIHERAEVKGQKKERLSMGGSGLDPWVRGMLLR